MTNPYRNRVSRWCYDQGYRLGYALATRVGKMLYNHRRT